MSDTLVSAEKRQPWIKWYTRDWRSNPKLRRCCPASRGIWADMLTLMAEATPVGYLLVDGEPLPIGELAALIGTPERDVKKALAELDAKRVYSVTGGQMPDDVAALVPADMVKGVILSRRMVRDEAKRQRDKANGGKGGNPGLNQKSNNGVNPPANAQRLEIRGQIPPPLAEASPVKPAREAAAAATGDQQSSPQKSQAVDPQAKGDDQLAFPAGLDRTVDRAFAIWNAHATEHGWPIAQLLNSTRRWAIQQRLGECGGLDGWRVALDAASMSEFITGTDGKPQRWFDLDWVIKPENFTRLMEGRYAERHRRPSDDRSTSAAIEGLREELAGSDRTGK